MFGAEPIEALAGGDITPSRFIKLSTAADGRVLQAGANEQVLGVAQVNTRDAPIDGASALAAAAGEPVMYVPEGNVCVIEVGAGGVTHGANVKSDTDGTAILAATTGAVMQWCGAIALESANQGEFARMLVKIFPIYPALS